MKLLLIYYNPNHDCFYSKLVNNVVSSDYRVGYVNQFQHQIVQIFYITSTNLISCNSYWDYINKAKDLDEPKINSLIDEVIRVLNKFKK